MLTFWKMTVCEFKLYLRETIGMFFTLVFPLIMLFLFGSIYGNEPTPYFGGRGTVDVSVPAYMGMIIGTAGLMAITIHITTYRAHSQQFPAVDPRSQPSAGALVRRMLERSPDRVESAGHRAGGFSYRIHQNLSLGVITEKTC